MMFPESCNHLHDVNDCMKEVRSCRVQLKSPPMTSFPAAVPLPSCRLSGFYPSLSYEPRQARLSTTEVSPLMLTSVCNWLPFS